MYFIIPSNRRLGSFSSRVSSSLAALRILARVNLTLHTSRLFLSPYSPESNSQTQSCFTYILVCGTHLNEYIPMSFNSWSRRDFSKGRRGVTYVLLQTQLLATGMAAYLCLQEIYVNTTLAEYHKTIQTFGVKFELRPIDITFVLKPHYSFEK